MSDHRDSIRHDIDGLPPETIADDLLLDAILAGRAEDDASRVRDRVRAACRAIDAVDVAPLARVGGDRHRFRRSLAAAAVLAIVAGLLGVLVARPTPAFAMVDASIARLESRDLTFRISIDRDEVARETSPTRHEPGERRHRGGRPGFERRLDGATIHVRGDRSVMLVPGRDEEILARGHADGRFWSNHLPEDVEEMIAARGGGGMPFLRFLEAVDGDVPSMLQAFRGGYVIEESEIGDEVAGESGWRRFTGTCREDRESRTPDFDRPRRGRPDRFDLWIDEHGDFRRLRLDGLHGPGGTGMGGLVLELIGTDSLDDAVFDPASYPEIHRAAPPRGGNPRGGNPRGDLQRGEHPRGDRPSRQE